MYIDARPTAYDAGLHYGCYVLCTAIVTEMNEVMRIELALGGGRGKMPWERPLQKRYSDRALRSEVHL